MNNVLDIDHYLFNIDCLHMEQTILENNLLIHEGVNIKEIVKKIKDGIIRLLRNFLEFIKGIKDKIINIFIKKKKSELDEVIDEVEDLDIDWDDFWDNLDFGSVEEALNIISEAGNVSYKYIEFSIDTAKANQHSAKELSMTSALVNGICLLPNKGFKAGVFALVKQMAKESGEDISELKDIENMSSAEMLKKLKEEENNNYRNELSDLQLKMGAIFHYIVDNIDCENTWESVYSFGLSFLTNEKHEINKSVFDSIKKEAEVIQDLLEKETKSMDALTKSMQKLNSKLDSVANSCKDSDDAALFRYVSSLLTTELNENQQSMQYRLKYYNAVIDNRKMILRKIISAAQKPGLVVRK